MSSFGERYHSVCKQRTLLIQWVAVLIITATNNIYDHDSSDFLQKCAAFTGMHLLLSNVVSRAQSMSACVFVHAFVPLDMTADLQV